MKNTQFILAGLVLLLSSTLSFGQNRISSPVEFSQEAMLSHFPAIVNLAEAGAAEFTLFYMEEYSMTEMSEFDFDSAVFSVEIFVEMVFANEPPSAQWDGWPAAHLATAYFPISTNPGIFRFISSVTPANTPMIRLPAPASGLHNLPSLTSRNHPSVLPLDDMMVWIELDDSQWNVNQKMNYRIFTTSFGDWPIRIGPDEKSYYFVPMVF